MEEDDWSPLEPVEDWVKPCPKCKQPTKARLPKQDEPGPGYWVCENGHYGYAWRKK